MTPDIDFTNADALTAKVLDLQDRAQAYPGDPTIAQEIQDFSMAVALAWKPQFDRLFAIVEDQRATLREQLDIMQGQTEQIHSLTERIYSLVACLNRYQTFRIPPGDSSYAND